MMDERSLGIARRLTISYVVASTAILAASGLLGVVLRWSQAVPQARVGDNFWYAMMTAHGLGAFVGWGAFAVMGLAWWVLAGVGFPVRGFGLAMARRHVVADGARRRRRDRHDPLHGLRRLVGLPLPAAVLRLGQLGRLGDRPLLVLRPARGARDRDLVLRDPAHGDEPRGAPQRLELDRQAARRSRSAGAS